MFAQLTEIQVWEFSGPDGAVVGHNLTLAAGSIVDIVGHLRGTRILACRLPGHPGLLLGVTCRVLQCDEDDVRPGIARDSRDERAGGGPSISRKSRCGTDGLSNRQRDLFERVIAAGIDGLPVEAVDIRVGHKLIELQRVERVPNRRQWTLRVKPEPVRVQRMREAS